MPVQFFGQYLVSTGVVSDGSIAEAVQYQRAVNIPLGALALSKALLTERQVLHIHTQQRRTDKPFGEIAVQRGYLTRAQLDDLLKEQAEARILLGEALVQKGHLSREQLNEALISYHSEQSRAKDEVVAALRAVEEATLTETAVELSSRMLLRMGNLVSKYAEVTPGARPALHDYWFTMAVGGDKSFTFGLGLEEPVLLALARRMLEEIPDEAPHDEVDELVLDAGKEFVNIVVGHVCSRLSRDGLNTMPEPADVVDVRATGAPSPPAGLWNGVVLRLPSGDVSVGVHVPPAE